MNIIMDILKQINKEQLKLRKKIIQLYLKYGLNCTDSTGIFDGYIGNKYVSFDIYVPYIKAKYELEEYMKNYMK